MKPIAQPLWNQSIRGTNQLSTQSSDQLTNQPIQTIQTATRKNINNQLLLNHANLYDWSLTNQETETALRGQPFQQHQRDNLPGSIYKRNETRNKMKNMPWNRQQFGFYAQKCAFLFIHEKKYFLCFPNLFFNKFFFFYKKSDFFMGSC